MTGPFDRMVKEICDSPHHLTPANREMLRRALGAPTEDEAFDEAVDGAQDFSLKKVMSRLARNSERLYNLAQSQNNVDDMKAAAMSLKQLMDMAIKYTDKVEAADRAQKIETALVDAVNSFGDEALRDRFLSHLKEALGQ